MKKIIRAVAYPRYSSDNQREESISAQMRAIEVYCEQKGYVLVNSYPDEARSATTDNRPNFQKMIKDSERCLFDVIVVHKLDRFARDRYDSAFYKRVLKKNGVRLESVLEHLDNSPESIILESVLEGMNEYYSKNLARETRKGLIENAKQGRHTGGRPPYGYKVNPTTKKLEVDETTAPAVRFYFESVAAGVPILRIADRLNDMGYRTYNGTKFTKNSFWDWARNKKYIGVYTWDVASARENGRRNAHKKKPESERLEVPDAIPAIISLGLWEEVQAVLEQRAHDKQKQGGHAKARQVYLLAGKINCGFCGAAYRGESYRSRATGDYLKYYKCGSRSSTGRCGNASIRKDEVERQVISYLIQHLFSDELIESIVNRVMELYEKERKNFVQDTSAIDQELAQLRRKIDNWIEAIGDGIVDRDVIGEKIREANQRKLILETELARIKVINRESNLSREAVREIMLKNKNALLSSDEEDKKRVLQEFVDQITVMPSKSIDDYEIKVTYRFSTGVEEVTPIVNLYEQVNIRISS